MSVALASTSTPNAMRQAPLRVMVVDDSVVIRGLIARWLGSEPDMVVAASLRTGLDAVNQIERVNPDVALLDIEMPDLDGISALPLLLAKKRNLIIIMASTLTDRKSTRLNSSHLVISYAVFCLKKKKKHNTQLRRSCLIQWLEPILNFDDKWRLLYSDPPFIDVGRVGSTCRPRLSACLLHQ